MSYGGLQATTLAEEEGGDDEGGEDWCETVLVVVTLALPTTLIMLEETAVVDGKMSSFIDQGKLELVTANNISKVNGLADSRICIIYRG
jgi:hypothetical protein